MEVVAKHKVEYFSPSSFNEFKRCRNLFWLSRISNLKEEIKKKDEGQGVSAGCGSAFDAIVKSAICSTINLDEMLQKEVTCPHRDIVIEAGAAFFLVYNMTALEYALNDGLMQVEIDQVKEVDGVMLRGKLDGQMYNRQALDWKIRGFWSAPKSPTAGWARKWENGKLVSGSHKRYKDCFGDINEQWATQLFIYALTQGHTPGETLTAYLEEMSMRSKESPPDMQVPLEELMKKINVTQYRNPISHDFQMRIWKELKEYWPIVEKMNAGEYVLKNTNTSVYKCERYGSLCKASSFCDSYQRTLGNPEVRRFLQPRKKKKKS